MTVDREAFGQAQAIGQARDRLRVGQLPRNRGRRRLQPVDPQIDRRARHQTGGFLVPTVAEGRLQVLDHKGRQVGGDSGPVTLPRRDPGPLLFRQWAGAIALTRVQRLDLFQRQLVQEGQRADHQCPAVLTSTHGGNQPAAGAKHLIDALGDGAAVAEALRTTEALTAANEGMTLTRHYCPAPVCAPSRGSLLMGRHQGHCAIRNSQFDKEIPDEHTLGSVLQEAGYATSAIGKWGLQGGKYQLKKPGQRGDRSPELEPSHPLLRGFDFYYGYSGHYDGHYHYPLKGNRPMYDGYKDMTDGLAKCYTTDLFTARTKKWITENNNLMTIVGHTHRPRFPEPGNIAFFNDGSCVHPRSITGIEIENGAISLIKWQIATKDDGTLQIVKDLLEGPVKLLDYKTE